MCNFGVYPYICGLGTQLLKIHACFYLLVMDINESWKQPNKTKEMPRNGFGEDLIAKNILMKCNVRCLER
jgi:hypothetical protein